MSDLEFDQKWQELRRKAGEEKDPFKLAALLSEMAALARQAQEEIEQNQTSPKADPPVVPIQTKGKAKRQRLVVPDTQPGVAPLRPRKGKYSKEESARYLKFAEAALRDDKGNSIPAETTPPRAKADPETV
jgi:hypothetical protein